MFKALLMCDGQQYEPKAKLSDSNKSIVLMSEANLK